MNYRENQAKGHTYTDTQISQRVYITYLSYLGNFTTT